MVCHPDRSLRQPHQLAQANRSTFLPRKSDKRTISKPPGHSIPSFDLPMIRAIIHKIAPTMPYKSIARAIPAITGKAGSSMTEA